MFSKDLYKMYSQLQMHNGTRTDLLRADQSNESIERWTALGTDMIYTYWM